MTDIQSAPDSFTIRNAVPEDLDMMVQIEKECFAIPWSDDAISEELHGGDRTKVLVAVTPDGSVIGYVGCWFVLEEGQINNVAVLPPWRNAGVGSALLASLLSLGAKEGIRQYSLEVRTSNAPARALYRKFGFVESGIRRGYYHDNDEDAIIMLKNAE